MVELIKSKKHIMKTKSEIIEHLLVTGYTDNARTKIMGDLIGLELKSPDEVLTVMRGIGTFDDFYKWFNELPNDTNYDVEEEVMITNILNDVVMRRDAAHSAEEYEYYDHQLDWLIYFFDVEVEYVDEDDEE